MNRPPAIFQANLMVVGGIVIGLLFAIILGVTLGEGDLFPLLLISGAILAILFAVGLYRYLWQMALFLVFLDFSFRPFGFVFGALEIGCGLGLVTFGLFLWQKRLKKPSLGLEQPSFHFLQRAIFVWLVYVTLHFLYNAKIPYRPTDFVLSNAVKSYFVQSVPLLLFFLFSRAPAGLVVRKDFYWTIAKVCFVCLVVDLSVRLYGLAGGTLYIPIINAMPGLYTLRSVGPLAMAMAVVGLTSGSFGPIRLLSYGSLFICGCVGCTISAGRVTLLIGLTAVCAILILRRKMLVLVSVFLIAVLGIALANFNSDWINNSANPHLQRSLQWALYEKKGGMAVDIESSSEWRHELFSRAMTEWRSSPRIFWTGRATYGFGIADETALLIAGGYEALIESSLRRGATHNLISDLLVAYGIIGFILYIIVSFAAIRFLWSLFRLRNLSRPAANLILLTLVMSVAWFVYAIVGGGFYPIELIWFMLVLVGAFHSGLAITERGDNAPARIPSFSSQRPRALRGQQRPVIRSLRP